MKIAYIYIFLILAGAFTSQSLALARLRRSQKYLGMVKGEHYDECLTPQDVKTVVNGVIQSDEAGEIIQGIESIVTQKVTTAIEQAVVQEQTTEALVEAGVDVENLADTVSEIIGKDVTAEQIIEAVANVAGPTEDVSSIVESLTEEQIVDLVTEAIETTENEACTYDVETEAVETITQEEETAQILEENDDDIEQLTEQTFEVSGVDIEGVTQQVPEYVIEDTDERATQEGSILTEGATPEEIDAVTPTLPAEDVVQVATEAVFEGETGTQIINTVRYEASQQISDVVATLTNEAVSGECVTSQEVQTVVEQIVESGAVDQVIEDVKEEIVQQKLDSIAQTVVNDETVQVLEENDSEIDGLAQEVSGNLTEEVTEYMTPYEIVESNTEGDVNFDQETIQVLEENGNDIEGVIRQVPEYVIEEVTDEQATKEGSTLTEGTPKEIDAVTPTLPAEDAVQVATEAVVEGETGIQIINTVRDEASQQISDVIATLTNEAVSGECVTSQEVQTVVEQIVESGAVDQVIEDVKEEILQKALESVDQTVVNDETVQVLEENDGEIDELNQEVSGNLTEEVTEYMTPYEIVESNTEAEVNFGQETIQVLEENGIDIEGVTQQVPEYVIEEVTDEQATQEGSIVTEGVTPEESTEDTVHVIIEAVVESETGTQIINTVRDEASQQISDVIATLTNEAVSGECVTSQEVQTVVEQIVESGAVDQVIEDVKEEILQQQLDSTAQTVVNDESAQVLEENDSEIDGLAQEVSGNLTEEVAEYMTPYEIVESNTEGDVNFDQETIQVLEENGNDIEGVIRQVPEYVIEEFTDEQATQEGSIVTEESTEDTVQVTTEAVVKGDTETQILNTGRYEASQQLNDVVTAAGSSSEECLTPQQIVQTVLTRVENNEVVQAAETIAAEIVLRTFADNFVN